jgi:hypothetical protein
MTNKNGNIEGILYKIKGEFNSLFSELKEIYKSKEKEKKP